MNRVVPPVDYDDRPDLIEALRARRPSTLERIADALGSDRMIPIYLAFVSGSLFSMAMAIIWAKTL